ncbi:hypothetical protein CDAR_253131 [Caerostris darwini]|uniref:Uncharacterized protein n=1 Tax=Caerostris darwini TaxID=1538125 RepID=A0AAV4R7V8_9ARAC|nr:hypothetical protein CDAR_253131 [Caerostris darwini]
MINTLADNNESVKHHLRKVAVASPGLFGASERDGQFLRNVSLFPTYRFIVLIPGIDTILNALSSSDYYMWKEFEYVNATVCNTHAKFTSISKAKTTFIIFMS